MSTPSTNNDTPVQWTNASPSNSTRSSGSLSSSAANALQSAGNTTPRNSDPLQGKHFSVVANEDAQTKLDNELMKMDLEAKAERNTYLGIIDERCKRAVGNLEGTSIDDLKSLAPHLKNITNDLPPGNTKNKFVKYQTEINGEITRREATPTKKTGGIGKRILGNLNPPGNIRNLFGRFKKD